MPSRGCQDTDLTEDNTHRKTKGYSKLRQKPNNETPTAAFTHLIDSFISAGLPSRQNDLELMANITHNQSNYRGIKQIRALPQ